MAEEFDLEAALANVHSASGRRPKPEPVERVHVFLPEQMRAEQKEKKVPWFVKQPDWNAALNKNSTTEPVQTSAQQLSLPGTPAAERRRFGCAICGSKTVMCKDDGSPYEHKCKHKEWCRTKSGHPVCEECEKDLVTRMEQHKLQQSAAQRQFAENLRQAEKVRPQVGWDIVEVTRAVTCPFCQTFLQGNRAVRVWVKKEGEWVVNNLQCLHHKPRPGVPMIEQETESDEQWWRRIHTCPVHLTHYVSVQKRTPKGVSYRVFDGPKKPKKVVWEKVVPHRAPREEFEAAAREQITRAEEVCAERLRLEIGNLTATEGGGEIVGEMEG